MEAFIKTQIKALNEVIGFNNTVAIKHATMIISN
jgi:hypothetical protein